MVRKREGQLGRETQRDTVHESARKQDGADGGNGEENDVKTHGQKRTATHAPLSGPRYRGSNSCLPAKTFSSSAIPANVIGVIGLARFTLVRIPKSVFFGPAVTALNDVSLTAGWRLPEQINCTPYAFGQFGR